MINLDNLGHYAEDLSSNSYGNISVIKNNKEHVFGQYIYGELPGGSCLLPGEIKRW